MEGQHTHPQWAAWGAWPQGPQPQPPSFGPWAANGPWGFRPPVGPAMQSEEPHRGHEAAESGRLREEAGAPFGPHDHAEQGGQPWQFSWNPFWAWGRGAAHPSWSPAGLQANPFWGCEYPAGSGPWGPSQPWAPGPNWGPGAPWPHARAFGPWQQPPAWMQPWPYLQSRPAWRPAAYAPYWAWNRGTSPWWGEYWMAPGGEFVMAA